MSDEDLIAEQDVVVTITRGGYAKRTKTDLYRAQRRGGKGVRGAQLRTDDIVEHFFVTTTHHWILFFTNKGRVYRAKAYELPEAARDARGQHVANLLAFQPDEEIAEVLALRDYTVAPYLVLATRSGLVKKSRLTDFDSPRTGGIIAISLREDDEMLAARLISPDEDLLLLSRHAQAIRFRASDESLRPMGRVTSGVIGMRFVDGDELLDMHVVRGGEDVLVATGGGFAKRTPAEQYPLQNRGGRGVLTARITESRGELVGALMTRPEDEVFAITSAGGVIRTRAGEVKLSGRQTMGVRLMNLGPGDSVVAIARNAESTAESLEAGDGETSESSRERGQRNGRWGRLMSARETGSDTWPRFAAFPGDNLDLGNVPEESDVDHDTEPPSWLSGAAAVGTGADPPDAGQRAEAEHDGQASPVDADAVGEDTSAPGFSDAPVTGPGFGAATDDAPGFEDPPGFTSSPGFGDAPDASQGFGAERSGDGFGGPAAAPASAPRASPPRPSTMGSRVILPPITRGSTPGRIRASGSVPPPRPGIRSAARPPGPMYDGAAAAAGYAVGQENGIGHPDQATPFQQQYPPTQQQYPRPSAVPPTSRRRRPSPG